MQGDYTGQIVAQYGTFELRHDRKSLVRVETTRWLTCNEQLGLTEYLTRYSKALSLLWAKR